MLIVTAAFCVGCEQRFDAGSGHDSHENRAGNVVTLGSGQYHAAFVIDGERTLRLFTLGADATRVVTVPEQVVTVYVREGNRMESAMVAMIPKRQAGDEPGRTSQFVGELPETLESTRLEIEIPALAFGYDRFRVTARIGDSEHTGMPRQLGAASERQLFLTSGGAYTEQDIAANEWKVPSEVYHEFVAEHEANPAAGERLCPITNTKANSDCVWTINGESYEFCCPPCIGELVKQAKERPDLLRPPESYVKAAD